MMKWLGREFLRRENSFLYTMWLVTCTMLYCNYIGWWAFIPLLIGTVVISFLEALWERSNVQ